MNKKLLKLALRLEKTSPVFSIIRELNEEIVKYQEENELMFFSAKRGSIASVTNEKRFFEFISSELLDGREVKSYAEIRKILNSDTREENIKVSGDSKTNYIRVFDNVVVVKKLAEVTQLLQKKDLDSYEAGHSFVAIENGESFLNIDSLASEFKYDSFIYLGGYSNTLTREFLKDKKVEFFLDFDIEGMNIYESFECKEKSFFIPNSIEELFDKYPNTELYKKQIKNLKQNYDAKLDTLEKLIKKHNTVVEQEVYR